MTQEKRIFRPATSKNICEIYELLNKSGLISFPLTQEGRDKVDAAISNINNLHFGVDIYPSVEEKVIAYLYFLIKNHPFVDGNKRTATLTFATVAALNNLTLNPDFSLDALAVFVEKVREADHQLVIKIIAREYFKTE